MNYALKREERREALGWGLLLALVTSLPYLLGYVASPAEKYFLGFVLNPADQNTYFMWMSQVASGELLLHNLYTSIPHEGAVLNLVFLVAGWTGKLLGSLDVAYQLLRLVAVVVLAWSVWLFVATFTASRERRRWLFLTVVFGAGIGPGQFGKARPVAGRAIKRGMRIQFMYTAHVDGVERVNIQNGLDVPAAMGQFTNLTLGGTAHGVGIEQDKLAAGQPDQRRLRAHIDNTADSVRTADVPEVVGDLKYLSGHVCCSCFCAFR